MRAQTAETGERKSKFLRGLGSLRLHNQWIKEWQARCGQSGGFEKLTTRLKRVLHGVNQLITSSLFLSIAELFQVQTACHCWRYPCQDARRDKRFPGTGGALRLLPELPSHNLEFGMSFALFLGKS
jgi:hypothetical protein